MAPSLTYRQFINLDPCDARMRYFVEQIGGPREWGDTPVTALRACAAGATYDDILWVASGLAQTDRDVERRLRLWEADCAAHVLRVFERSQPNDYRPRTAIAAARAYARGQIDDAARDAVWELAWAAAWAAPCDAAWAAAGAAAGAAEWAGARAAAGAAAGPEPGAAAWDAAEAAERAWQFDRLVARLSDPEPDDVPIPGG